MAVGGALKLDTMETSLKETLQFHGLRLTTKKQALPVQWQIPFFITGDLIIKTKGLVCNFRYRTKTSLPKDRSRRAFLH